MVKNKLNKIRNLRYPIYISSLFILFIILIIMTTFYLSYSLRVSSAISKNATIIQFNDSIIQLGTFVILSLTLIALILYTLFTYILAIKKEDSIVTATIKYIPETKDIRVIQNNPTLRYAKTRVWVNAEVYGKIIDLGPAYSGQIIWDLTPQFMIDGHFLLEDPLNKAGKSFSQMQEEANEHNIENQLHLSLKIKWEDEDGLPGESPTHYWHFDFKNNRCIYKVGGF